MINYDEFLVNHNQAPLNSCANGMPVNNVRIRLLDRRNRCPFESVNDVATAWSVFYPEAAALLSLYINLRYSSVLL